MGSLDIIKILTTGSSANWHRDRQPVDFAQRRNPSGLIGGL